MAFTVIDLSQLPPPNVVEPLDYEQIVAAMLSDLRQRDAAFTALVESDPAYKVLEVCAYRELLLRARVNDGARGIMLPYATGSDLDTLGAYWNVQRLVIDEGDSKAIPPREKILEADAPFRERIQLSMEGQTNAGTHGAYLYQTRLADEQVKSAAAKSPSAGEVVITVLSHEDEGAASADVLSRVSQHLQQPHVRQMTDKLTIQSADIVTYRVKATLYIAAGPGSNQVMEAARQALTQYVSNMHKIGNLVPISGIYGALQQPGVVRVDLASPAADIVVSDVQAPYCSAIELTQAVAL